MEQHKNDRNSTGAFKHALLAAGVIGVDYAVVTILTIFFACPLWAGNVYYVSPVGNPEGSGGTGTLGSPYDLATGIAKATSASDEVRFLKGTYLLDKKISLVTGVAYSGWDASSNMPVGKNDCCDVVIDGQGTVCCFESVNLNGRWTIAGMTIRNGYKSSDGTCLSALNVTGISLVSNCVFTGGIYGQTMIKANVYAGANSLRFADCDFSATTNNAFYGLLNVDGVIFESCHFVDNVSTQSGNGYGSLGYGSATFLDCSFVNNVLTANGGLCLSSGNFARCLFEGNSSKGNGCCVQAFNTGTIVLDTCRFERNHSKGVGGCISGGTISGTSPCGNVYATNCVFTGNSSGSHGGVVSLKSGSATAAEQVVFVDCAFTNNVSAGIGGAIYLNSVVNFAIERCSFVDNVSTGANAAVRISDDKAKLASGVVRNSLFLRNVGVGEYQGGTASALQMPDHTFVDCCTFVSNICMKGLYGALNVSGANEARIRNCIFWKNRSAYAASSIYGQFGVSSTGDEMYWSCCSQYGFLDASHGNLNGTSNSPLDPGFANIAEDNWSLDKESPCIDAGVNQAWMVGAHDIRNLRKFPRIANGTVDIGCYEYRLTPGMMFIFK